MAGQSQEIDPSFLSFIRSIPKAELHVHIEGTFEPKLMFDIAERNGIALQGTVQSHAEQRANFKNLQDFLDMYYKACDVLRTEQDFYDLMYAYLKRAALDCVSYAEIFFDPQTHTDRGVPFETVINGLFRAIVDGQKNFDIRARLIMCFLRHLPEDNAMATLEHAKPHVDKILGVGLDSGEAGNPPSKFAKVFEQARLLGLKLVAHAGEEAGPEYIREALDVLCAQRIDHGVQCLKDCQLVERLARDGVPLTVCPNSNWKLKVNRHFFGDVSPIRELLCKNVRVTINSDDPAYFGGYISDNFITAVNDAGLTKQDVFAICQNAFKAAFLPPQDKELYLEKLKDFGIGMGLLPIPKNVSIFGGHGLKEGSKGYEFARTLGQILAKNGYTILNGGYSGTMEASARGASERGGRALGCLSPSTFTNRVQSREGNEYISDCLIATNTFERTARLVMSSFHVVVLPGSSGTAGEFFHTWYQASVGGIRGSFVPKILLVREPWEAILSGLYEPLYVTKAHPIIKELIVFFDTPQEALEIIEKDRKQRLKQD